MALTLLLHAHITFTTTNIYAMEMGYNTLDLAMLAIAATVIYAASRVPVKDAPPKKVNVKSKLTKSNSSFSLK